MKKIIAIIAVLLVPTLIFAQYIVVPVQQLIYVPITQPVLPMYYGVPVENPNHFSIINLEIKPEFFFIIPPNGVYPSREN